MSNTFVLSTIVVREGLAILRNFTNRASTVYRGLDQEWQTSPRKPGDTVYVPVPPTLVARDATSDLAGGGLQTQNLTETSVAVTVDQHPYVRVAISSTDAALAMDTNSLPEFRRRVLYPQLIPLIEDIETNLQALYKDVPYWTGTAASTPDSLDDIANAGAILTTNKAPLIPNRVMDLNPTAYAKLWPLMAQLRSANPENDALRAAYVGTVGGFDTFQSQLIPSHTKGTLDAGALATGTAGASTIAIASGGNGGTVKDGDIFTIAGSTQQFCATEDKTATAGGVIASLAIYPALPTGFSPAGAAITLIGSHTANMGYTKNAFCLAMAKLEAPMGGAVGAVEVDPETGFALRAVYDWANMSNVIDVDILYGVKTLRAEEAVRLLG